MRARNQKPTHYDTCIISGTPFAELHEIFYGTANSQISKKYGVQVRLSNYWHQDHRHGVHHNDRFNRILKEIGQMAFEEVYSKEKFYSLYQKNYIGTHKYNYPQESWEIIYNHVIENIRRKKGENEKNK